MSSFYIFALSLLYLQPSFQWYRKKLVFSLSMAYCLLFYFHSFFYIWSYLSNGLEEFRFLLNLSIWHIVFFFHSFSYIFGRLSNGLEIDWCPLDSLHRSWYQQLTNGRVFFCNYFWQFLLQGNPFPAVRHAQIRLSFLGQKMASLKRPFAFRCLDFLCWWVTTS